MFSLFHKLMYKEFMYLQCSFHFNSSLSTRNISSQKDIKRIFCEFLSDIWWLESLFKGHLIIELLETASSRSG